MTTTKNKSRGGEGILIRRALAEDLDDVLNIESLWPTTPHWTRSHFERELTSERSYFCVLTSNGRIAGYAGLILIPPEAQVTTVAVHPEQTRKGFGRKLMEHLHQQSGKSGCGLLTLEASEKNKPALRLYESLGYRIVGRRSKYYNDSSDALLMTNHLAAPRT